MRYSAVFVLLVCVLACAPGVAFAHSVYIFAWVDGTQVCTESYFTQSSKVRGGEVTMATPAGEILGKGVTNEAGVLCLPAPITPQPLEFAVLAGTGHRGSFRLEAQALAEDSNKAMPTAPVQAGQPAAALGSVPENTQASPPSAATAVQPSADTEAFFRRIVQEEVQKQMSPLRQAIAEKLEDKTPRLHDIIGGIGWLLGLGAIGAWWAQQRKKH